MVRCSELSGKETIPTYRSSRLLLSVKIRDFYLLSLLYVQLGLFGYCCLYRGLPAAR